MGSFFSTFVLLEVFGDRLLLWIGCLLNALLGVIARAIARSMPDALEVSDTPPAVATALTQAADESAPVVTNEKAEDADAEAAQEATEDEKAQASEKPESSHEDKPEEIPLAAREVVKEAPSGAEAGAPPQFVLAAAAIVGFTFLLMELVFYRILGPVLGGSTYTFGLILAIALLGVGIGGAAYPVWFAQRPVTISAFAVTCVLEALGFAIPYALGDRIALLAIAFRSFEPLGFAALVGGWFVVAAIVVLPAAIVSGLQFPLLIALLGKARKDAGRHVGLAYGWNTIGAIAGSLAGGFGFLPLLTAPGVWRISALLLLGLGVGAMILSARIEKKMNALVLPTMATIVTLLLVRAVGPTAALRHSPIGAGRAGSVLHEASINSVRDWMQGARRAIVWEADGVESSVALNGGNGYSFIVNGKADGHVRMDAGTQVMGGLIGALLHPAPRNALVVGLGTGSTAGWLGAVPTMERVDVVELEPAIVRVARDCTPVNHDALDNPKLHVFIGDAREVLITTKQRYDIIFSEPSNPYRAGIASLFTADFYQSVTKRLAPGGIFLQWLQSYEVDGQTIRTVYATLGSVFPNVETWMTESGDLVLAATLEPTTYDVTALRARVAEEPFRSALANAWSVSDVEGFFAHYIANDKLTRVMVKEEAGTVNSDDQNLLEFSFARMAGRHAIANKQQIVDIASVLQFDRIEHVNGQLDPSRLWDQRAQMLVTYVNPIPPSSTPTPDQQYRMSSFAAYMKRDYQQSVAFWRKQSQAPNGLNEIEFMAHALSAIGDPDAPAAIDKLRSLEPTAAEALVAIYQLQKNALPEATDAAVKAFELFRKDAWPSRFITEHLLSLAPSIALKDKAQGRRLLEAVSQPFAVGMHEDARRRARMQLASRVDFPRLCVDAVSAYEPNVPFRADFLTKRLECYTLTHHPLRIQAMQDLDDFYEND
ncbi:MAG TPA: fused MFS/spermidine synthase, partial [Polyangium sp.]|nr:fused MFS/spermidine synthase [Polyangium sp.]